MTSEWVTLPVGKVLALQRGHDLPSQNRELGNIPIIGSSGLTGFHNKAKADGPGVIIGRSGNSMGEVSYCKNNYWPLNTALYVTDFKGNDPRFIYYLLTTIDFDQFNSGSAQKSLNRNAVYPFEVTLPSSVDEQRKISSILSTLEEKIQLNQQINQTLEQMAQAIFKSWFVDFEPVKAKIAALEAGGSKNDALLAAMQVISGKDPQQLAQLQTENSEHYTTLRATAELFPAAMQESELGAIPKGWVINEIQEISSKISKGTTPSKILTEEAKDKEVIPFLKVRDLSDNGEISRINLDKVPETIHLGALKRSILQKDDLLFSIAGTIGRVAVIEEDLANSNCNQAIAFIRLNEPEKHLELCRLNLISNQVQNEVASKVVQGVQANFSLTGLGQIKIVMPHEKLLLDFNQVVLSISEKQKLVLSENRNLTGVRDTLLPKLLSGELSVNQDAD